MTDYVRILLIDDDEEDFLIVSDMLSQAINIKFRLNWVQKYDAGLEAISRREHDVYLLDYFLDSHNGLELLREAVAGGCTAPIIFLTAHGNYVIDIQAMEAGASDYLVKGEFTAPVLERSIRYSLISKQVQEELKQHRSNLEELVRKRTVQHAEARAYAEHRANQAERRQAILEALLEHIPEGIAIVDSPDLEVQALSGYALNMLGISDRVEGRFTDQNLPISDLGPSGSDLQNPLRDAALHGEILSNHEYTLRDPTGEEIAVLVSAGPIRDGFGNITGAVAAWRDISELKRIQEELRSARDHLELRVHQRTLELARTMMELRESKEEMKFLASQLITAQENERKRIAREMHDSIGSSLSAVKFCVENAAKQLDDKPPIQQAFMTLSRAVEHAIEESRRIMTDLRPSILDDLGILATISWFCRQYEEIYTKIELQRDIRVEESEVPENLKIIIFRILQESMNNAAKYSRAEKILISLAIENGQISLHVGDNGVGFDPKSVTSRGGCVKFGLTSMRERAELSGGKFEIESGLGIGTKVRACWQIQQPSTTCSGSQPSVK